MKSIRVRASGSYRAAVGPGLLKETGTQLLSLVPPCAAALVSDDRVFPLYGPVVRSALEAAGFSVCSFVFPAGEAQKNMSTLCGLLEFLAQRRLTRTDVVVALGGGVVGDLAGFAASVYLRGLRVVQLPTTLLAAIDSSVGGKTGVNLCAGKNLAGTFHQPSLVLCDTDALTTLPEAVFADGAAEAVKYGVLTDPPLFRRLSEGGPRADLEALIVRCIAIKAQFVRGDEQDRGKRQFLNLGHTAGHAVERCSGYAVSHGSAVAMGMVAAARAAERLGLAEEACADVIAGALSRCGLPTHCPFDAGALNEAALSDKKRKGGDITLVLPRRIGECFLHTIPVDGLLSFFEAGLRREAV